MPFTLDDLADDQEGPSFGAFTLDDLAAPDPPSTTSPLGRFSLSDLASATSASISTDDLKKKHADEIKRLETLQRQYDTLKADYDQQQADVLPEFDAITEGRRQLAQDAFTARGDQQIWAMGQRQTMAMGAQPGEWVTRDLQDPDETRLAITARQDDLDRRLTRLQPDISAFHDTEHRINAQVGKLQAQARTANDLAVKLTDRLHREAAQAPQPWEHPLTTEQQRADLTAPFGGPMTVGDAAQMAGGALQAGAEAVAGGLPGGVPMLRAAEKTAAYTASGAPQVASGVKQIGMALAAPIETAARALVVRSPADLEMVQPRMKQAAELWKAAPKEIEAGVSDALEGAFKLATPALMAGAVTAPLETALMVGLTTGGSAAGEKLASAAGADEVTARFVGDLTGLAGAAVAGKGMLEEFRRFKEELGVLTPEQSKAIQDLRIDRKIAQDPEAIRDAYATRTRQIFDGLQAKDPDGAQRVLDAAQEASEAGDATKPVQQALYRQAAQRLSELAANDPQAASQLSALNDAYAWLKAHPPTPAGDGAVAKWTRTLGDSIGAVIDRLSQPTPETVTPVPTVTPQAAPTANVRALPAPERPVERRTTEPAGLSPVSTRIDASAPVAPEPTQSSAGDEILASLREIERDRVGSNSTDLVEAHNRLHAGVGTAEDFKLVADAKLRESAAEFASKTIVMKASNEALLDAMNSAENPREIIEHGKDAAIERTERGQPNYAAIEWNKRHRLTWDGRSTLASERVEPRSYASTQVDLPSDLATKVRAVGRTLIPDTALAADGREETPHITVQYGLKSDADVQAVREALKDQPPIRVALGPTSIFPASESGGSDVVKVDVTSPDLRALRTKIAAAVETPGDTHPTYQPHVTLAYVKSGEGQKFAGATDLVGQTMTLDAVTFSRPDGTKISIPLKGKVGTAETPATRPLLTPEQLAEQVKARLAAKRQAAPAAQVSTPVSASSAPATGRFSSEDLESEAPPVASRDHAERAASALARVRQHGWSPEFYDAETKTWTVEPAQVSDEGRSVGRKPRASSPPKAVRDAVAILNGLPEGVVTEAIAALDRSSSSLEPTAKTPTESATLPVNLAGAKPRYNYGTKEYLPKFANDLNLAAYIVAQSAASKRDSGYLKFVMDQTGLDEEGARAFGRQVKEATKLALKGRKEFEVQIPSVVPQITAPSAPAQAAPSINEPATFDIKSLQSGKTSTVTVPPVPQRWTEIGQNSDGLAVYEDKNGVRSVVENGVRQTEPVKIVPSRGGVSVRPERSSYFQPVEPAAVAAPVAALTPDEQAEVDGAIDQRRAYADHEAPGLDRDLARHDFGAALNLDDLEESLGWLAHMAPRFGASDRKLFDAYAARSTSDELRKELRYVDGLDDFRQRLDRGEGDVDQRQDVRDAFRDHPLDDADTQRFRDRLRAAIARKEGQQGELPLSAEEAHRRELPFTAAHAQAVFGLTPEQATAAVELADALGLPKDKIRWVQGGRPGDSALLQTNAPQVRKWYYSNIERALGFWQPKGTAAQFLAHLGKMKGAMEEAEAIGLPEWLKGREKVTRAEVQQYLTAHQIDVREVQLSDPVTHSEAALDALRLEGFSIKADDEGNAFLIDPEGYTVGDPKKLPKSVQRVWQDYLDSRSMPTKFSPYQTNGGTNYREILLTLPATTNTSGWTATISTKAGRQDVYTVSDANGQYVHAPLASSAAEAIEKAAHVRSGGLTYQSSHWDEPNVLAHLRVNDREIGGKRTLFVEEFQKEGAGKSGLPFTKSWTKLVLKRALAYASEHGYEAIAWTTGAMQQARYDLSKQVRSVSLVGWQSAGPDMMLLTAFRDGEQVLSELVHKDKLDRYIGKQPAERLLQAPKDPMTGMRRITGDDLKVGGQWAENLYDKELPNLANEIGKKYGVKTGKVVMPGGHVESDRPAGIRTDFSGEQFEYHVVRTGGEDAASFGTMAEAQQWLEEQQAKFEREGPGIAVHAMELPLAMREAIRDEGLPLFQGEKGAIEFVEGGKILIHAGKGADFSTIAHELFHAARRLAIDRNLPVDERGGITDDELHAFETWAGAKDGAWTREAEEKAAKGFERYLLHGEAPSSKLKGLFAKIAGWLRSVYDRMMEYFKHVDLTPEARRVYDKLVQRGEYERPARAVESARPAVARPAAPSAGRAPPMAIPAERAAAIAKLKARRQALYQAGEALPSDDDLLLMSEIVTSYHAEGLSFDHAARQFQAEFGAGARELDEAFETAWEILTGDTQAVASALEERIVGGESPHAGQDLGVRPGSEGRPAAASERGEPAVGAIGAGVQELADQQPVAAPVRGEVPAQSPGRGERGETSRPRRDGAGNRDAGERDAAGPDRGVDAASHVDPADRPQPPAVHDAGARGEAPRHFVIAGTDDLTAGGWVSKLDANLKALELLKQLEKVARPASAAEQDILARYIGWGHTNLAPVVEMREGHEARDPKQIAARQLLDTLLTPAELRELGESTANSHYSFNDLPRTMWAAVQRMGFQGGAILEPAVGTGHFFGTMPTEILGHRQTKLFGVDKEPIAAAIAKQLYQGAFVQTGPLQEVMLPAGYFDLVISNVPFGDYAVFDPTFASTEKSIIARSIHNYYFGKALDLTRPGGLIAFITSRWTMDKRDDVVRRYITSRARLIAAVRLPQEAFRKTAGTDVVADILFLQKYPEGVGPSAEEAAWLESVKREDLPKLQTAKGAKTIRTNEYFVAHPEAVLGTESNRGKMQAGPAYTVEGFTPEGLTAEQLRAVVERFPQGIYTAELGTKPTVARSAPLTDHREGAFVLEKGKPHIFTNGVLEPVKLSVADVSRVKAFIPLRDAYQVVLAALTERAGDADLQKAQKDLRRRYDQFTSQHGPVNQSQNRDLILQDPNGPRILALEEFSAVRDPVTGRKTRKVRVTKLAGIFDKRVTSPPVEPTAAASASDALVQSLAWRGSVDLAYMSNLLGQPIDAVTQGLIGQIYQDPVTNDWLAADAYLSGDVVTKLAQAEARAQADPAFAGHVAALTAVQPTLYRPEDISVPFGATYVPPPTYQRFLKAETNADITVSLLNTDTKTEFTAEGFGTAQYLPDGENLGQWVTDALNNALPDKYSGSGDDRHKDAARTERYRESLQQLREAWQSWWPSDPDAATDLTGIYNAMFNRTVARDFDGSKLIIPNQSPAIQLRSNQRDTVWRILQAGNTLVDTAVGGGKTYTLIAAAGEMKRQGLARKPMITVPNPLVVQWQRSFLDFYPTANILVPSAEDFAAANRRRFIARVANNDWDAIIIAHSQFERIAVRPETLRAFVTEQETQLLLEGADQTSMSVADFDTLVTRYGDPTDKDAARFFSGRNSERSVKAIAKAVLRLRARLQKRLNQAEKDASVSFEDLGVDALFVDESHFAKNLFYSTSKNKIAGLNQSDADRAVDMFLKVRLINKASKNRNVVFATGTPITNAMSEVYTVFRYLGMDTLERLGMSSFDAWSNNYAIASAEMEPDPTGGYKERTRLRDWANLKDLSRLYRQFTDVVTTQDLVQSGAITLPAVKHGQPTIIALEPSPGFDDFMAGLQHRVDAIKSGEPSPPNDNMLWITSDASKAAIDLRLVMNAARDPNGRIPRAGKEIAARYKASAADKGVQLVFLDIGVPDQKEMPKLPKAILDGPHGEEVAVEGDAEPVSEGDADLSDDQIAALNTSGRNLYEDLRNEIVKHGVKDDEIVYIHQAKTPEEQRALYQAVNDGRVRVFVATRAKGGVGLNVQTRVMAIHHLDVPWRPDQLEQADARGLRHGNTNKEVEIIRYVTKRTFDEYRWKLIALKNAQILAFKKGEIDRLEDIDPGQISLDAAAAIASGDERKLTILNLERHLRALRARAANFDRRQTQAKRDLAQAEGSAVRQAQIVDALQQAHTEALAWAADQTVEIVVQSGHYGLVRREAPQAFAWGDPDGRKRFQAAIEALLSQQRIYNDERIAQAGPFEVWAKPATIEEYQGGQKLYAEGVSVYVKAGELVIGTSPDWMKADAHAPDYRRSLDAYLDPVKLKEAHDRLASALARSQEAVESNREVLTKVFPQSEELRAKEEELSDLKRAVGIVSGKEIGQEVADELQKAADAYETNGIDRATFDARTRALWTRAENAGVTDRVRKVLVDRQKPAPGSVDEMRAVEVEKAASAQAKAVPTPTKAQRQDLIDAFTPTQRKRAGELAHMQWRAELGRRAQAIEHAVNALKAYRPAFVTLSRDPEAVLRLADAVELPGPEHPVPSGFEAPVKIMAEQYEPIKRALEEAGLDIAWRDNYLARGNGWAGETSSREAEWLKRMVFRKRPIEGSKAFLKQRTFPTMRERREVTKQEPPTWNLIDLDILKKREMNQLLVGRRMADWMKGRGLGEGGAMFVPISAKAPRGLEQIDDPVFTVYKAPTVTVREAYDKLLMEGLEAWTQDLGIDHLRKPTHGKSWGAHMRNAAGESTIKTKFGGPETALIHEIGHALDAMGLGEKLRTGDPAIDHELLDLSALRYEGETPTDEFRSYVERPNEQIANAVHAYIYAPMRMSQVAPHTYEALTALADQQLWLAPLKTLQSTRSLVLGEREAELPLGGPVLMGRYYALPEVARVINNYVKPGLRGKSALLDAWLWMNNAMVRAVLAFPGFHAVAITKEAGTMAWASALQAAADGKALASTKAGAMGVAFPAEAYRLYMKGKAAQQEYLSTDPGSALVNEVTRRIILGGQRIHMERDYSNQSLQKLRDAVRMQRWGGTLYHLLPGALEAMTIPVLEWFVPRVKLGAYLDRVSQRLASLPGDPDLETMQRICTEESDHVDNAFGEMVKDNLAWPRALHHALQGAMVSPTWNIGSVRGFAGGVTDLRRVLPGQRREYRYTWKDEAGGVHHETVKEPIISVRTAWTIAVVALAAYTAELYQRTHGAGNLQSTKDVFAPRTGRTNPDGTAERVTTPGYEKELFTFFHRFPSSAVYWGLSKTGPMPTLAWDIWANQDYTGTQVRNPDDPLYKQAADLARQTLEHAKPVAVDSVERELGRGTTVDQMAERLMGIRPASREISQSDAERKMREYLGPAHRTQEQAALGKLKADIRTAMRNPTASNRAKAGEAIKTGELTPGQLQVLGRRARMSALGAGFTGLPLKQALTVYDLATPDERTELRPILQKKALAAVRTVAPADFAEVRRRLRAAMMLPVAGAGTANHR